VANQRAPLDQFGEQGFFDQRSDAQDNRPGLGQLQLLVPLDQHAMQAAIALATALIIIDKKQSSGHGGELEARGGHKRQYRVPPPRDRMAEAMRVHQDQDIESHSKANADSDEDPILANLPRGMAGVTIKIGDLMLHSVPAVVALELFE
jgi:hypothetical protein